MTLQRGVVLSSPQQSRVCGVQQTPNVNDRKGRDWLDWSCSQASVPWDEVFPRMVFLWSSDGWMAAPGCFLTWTCKCLVLPGSQGTGYFGFMWPCQPWRGTVCTFSHVSWWLRPFLVHACWSLGTREEGWKAPAPALWEGLGLSNSLLRGSPWTLFMPV